MFLIFNTGLWYHNSFLLEFFTALKMFLSSAAVVVVLGRPVRSLLLSTPVVSVFFRTVQIVVFSMPRFCAMALIDFLSFLRFKNGLHFSHRHLSALVVALFPRQMQTSRLKSKAKTRQRRSELFNVQTIDLKATSGKLETPLSHRLQYFCAIEKWVGSNKNLPCPKLLKPSRCKYQEIKAETRNFYSSFDLKPKCPLCTRKTRNWLQRLFLNVSL